MGNHKTKLELTWIGKENRPKLEPRILVDDPAKSHHAPFRLPAPSGARQARRTISDKLNNRLQRDILLWQSLTK